jgi:hypothetical protein
VKRGKLSPPTTTPSRTPSSRKPASSTAPTPASRKRKASTLDAQDIRAASILQKLHVQDSGPNEGCDGYINGCSSTTCSSTGTGALLNEVNRRLIVDGTNDPKQRAIETTTSTAMTEEEELRKLLCPEDKSRSRGFLEGERLLCCLAWSETTNLPSYNSTAAACKTVNPLSIVFHVTEIQ